MATILNIETSTTVCSVAVGIDGKCISLHEINNGYSHAEELENLVEKALNEAKITLKNLDAVSISKGPGSYTGLRIGVSFSKGLCYGLNIPLISVPTLEAMALHPLLENQTATKIPLLDARRMEVYSCALDANNQVITPTQAVVVDETSYQKELQEKVVFFGPGMEKCRETLETHPNSIFVENILPSARQMAQISEELYGKSSFENVAYFEPFYLKDFVAGKPKKLL